jgi:CRISPR/Cas system CSM-associated protein Csm2 small subunit
MEEAMEKIEEDKNRAEEDKNRIGEENMQIEFHLPDTSCNHKIMVAATRLKMKKIKRIFSREGNLPYDMHLVLLLFSSHG